MKIWSKLLLFLIFVILTTHSLTAQGNRGDYKAFYSASFVFEGAYTHGIQIQKRVKRLGYWDVEGEIGFFYAGFGLPFFRSPEDSSYVLNVWKPYGIRMFTFGGYFSRYLLHQSPRNISLSFGVLARPGGLLFAKLYRYHPIVTQNKIGASVGYVFGASSELNIVLPIKLVFELRADKKISYVLSPFYYYVPNKLAANVQMVGLSVGIGF